jgi:hypothetical protein
MGVAALVIIGVGLLLVLLGTYVSLREWNAQFAKRQETTEGLSAEGTLKGLAKLAAALAGKPLGFQLIIIGFGLVIIGGIIGGVSAL